jgi:hypothetical protein
MPEPVQLLYYAAAVVIGVALVFVVRARRQSHRAFLDGRVDEEVCEHLKAAWDVLRSRGCSIVNAGQRAPDMPFEIHIDMPFDPQAVFDEARLAEPAFVSERRVLYCKDDWIEIHPPK